MHDKAEKFERLHSSDETFIMANAWNAGSAVILEEAGFKAIATTSAGVAYSHALPDQEGAVSFQMALDETRKIATAVNIPVSMDAENGYGDSPESVAENIKKIVATSVVGANIEDYAGNNTGNNNKPLYDLKLATERIQSAKESLAKLDYPFMLTGRTDCFLSNHPTPLKEAITRLNQFKEAGADCLFAPGVKDIATIKTLVKETNGAVTVVMGLAGSPISLAELQDAGVSRISIGGSLARATFGLVRNAAKEMLEKGTFDYSKQQIVDAELCELFSNKK